MSERARLRAIATNLRGKIRNFNRGSAQNHPRRLESKLDPRYIAAKKEQISKMRAGYMKALREGTLKQEPNRTHRLNTDGAREKAMRTRADPSYKAKVGRKISNSLRKYFSEHGVPLKPPITEETRLRMSQAAKRRGMPRSTIEAARVANIARCSKMTADERKAMFHGKKTPTTILPPSASPPCIGSSDAPEEHHRR